MSRRPYFKFYFQDFLTGVGKATLTPEEVGMYVMMLGFIWEDEGATTSDIANIGVRTGWGKRLTSRLVSQLLAKKKIVDTGDGHFTNARMEKEIVAFVNVKKAAIAREESKRKSVYSPTIEPLETDYRATTNNLFLKKHNKNNTTATTDGAYLRNQKPETRLVCERAGARDGEEDFGFGVYVNCRTVRHSDFQISLDAIDQQLENKFPKDQIKAVAIGHALQWATEIEGGKSSSDAVPANIANFISKSIRGDRRKRATPGASKKPSTPGTSNYWAELAELAGESGVTRR